jgi:hypothetical protein
MVIEAHHAMHLGYGQVQRLADRAVTLFRNIADVILYCMQQREQAAGCGPVLVNLDLDPGEIGRFQNGLFLNYLA